MVYRSSRRPPQNEEEADRLQETTSFDSDDSNKEVKFLQQTRTWKTLSLFLALLCIAFCIGMIVAASKNTQNTIPLCGKSSKSIQRIIDMSEPDNPGPFHDLTRKEINNILTFLRNDPDVKLKKYEETTPRDCVLFMMDLLPAKKSEVWAYLAGQRDQPDRQARVILFRRDLNPPMVHELACGPLPRVSKCSLIKSDSRRNPVEYSLRPLFMDDLYVIKEVLLKKIDQQIGYILRESYGTSYYDCKPNTCLEYYPSPMGTNLVGNINYRRMWLSALYPNEYYGENPVDFAVLANLDGADPSNYHVSKIWYHEQFFESVDDFILQYNQSTIQKSRLRPPIQDPRDSYSSLYRRGDPLPETPQRPPTLVEPDGKRYSLKNREVEYLGWKFNFRMSPISGPSIHNIRYKGDRIAYELSLAEIAVLYSSNNPMQRATDYVDSGALIGVHSRSLIPGADCPETATFISQNTEGFLKTTWDDIIYNQRAYYTFPDMVNGEPEEVKRAFCLFENNHGFPARRHLSYSQKEGAFYGGMLDSALTLRSILTVVNYDYVIDFVFHQTGTVQARALSTGYILPAFYNPAENPYGFVTEKNFIASLHHHMFHFKVDLDISGTSNRYETLDIKPDVVQLRVPPNPKYHQTKLDRNLYKTEKDALFKFNFDQPKYHIVHNNAKQTDFGAPKAYRIQLQGMSKQLVTENKGNEGTVPWGRHQLVVTRHKDEEQLSSSPYGMFDSLNPVVNFSKFYDDDENIVDEDLVFWITCGIHHIPHSEDLPITPTVGAHLSFFLSPYNYFPQCPSFSSRDHVRIQLKNKKNPKEGVTIDRNGYSDDQCRTPPIWTEYEELLRDDPNVVVESRNV